MNGMTRKKQRRDHAARYTEDGIPRDANEWIEEDWAILHAAMEEVRRKIGGRHGKRNGDGRKRDGRHG